MNTQSMKKVPMSDIEASVAASLSQLYLEIEELYHGYAKRHGLSDSMLWLLYSLRTYQGRPTQRRLCDEWHISPQTMNYALKSLERRGYIELEPLLGGRHDKAIKITRQGRGIVESVIEPLMQHELQALGSLGADEQRELLALTGKLVLALRDALRPADSRRG